MRSRHADRFNHDEDAPGYDADVADEGNPIRAGYSALLDWVVSRAEVGPEDAVLELGTGTGNLTRALGPARRTLCVDVSSEMLALAREKLADRSDVDFLEADLLEAFESIEESFDVVVSTYAIHHLTPGERAVMFREVAGVLRPGGRAVFGDLMFADADHRRRYLAGLRSEGDDELADEIEDEFFWDLA
ncbi:MAG: class I SAM-dependent methyltransferase, partial [Thermoanaerobaculia bacterium]|nr:class I SAM-dependent methyltransferase [Thermoanaerobaculia bacterium]